MRKPTLLLASAPLLLATSAGAQGLGVALEGGYRDLTGARDSAEAVFGSAGGFAFGGAASYGLRKGFYLEIGFRHFGKDGQRVFVADRDAPVFRLGHPLMLRLDSFDASVGCRVRRRSVFVPYAGAGLGFVSYREESTVAGVTDRDRRTRASGHLLAGVELGRRAVRGAIEAGYSFVPGTVGLAGVSKVYGESDVGGLTLLARLVYRPGGKPRR